MNERDDDSSNSLDEHLAVDAICLKFEKELRAEKQPKIEAFLKGNSPSLERELVEQLIALELDYLGSRGQQLSPESYWDRFPTHRSAVERVFAASKDSRHTTAFHQPTEKPGSTIGPYRLLEQIGEGGMGVVFMAEQQKPVRRKVALKIIKPGMDTKQVIARFEAERQALAMMDHPNIARVLDANSTDSGRPYFVMELVRGVPITEYCDQNKLPTNERLQLFVSVCQAVQHAHTKGIIHRDIKPSNVLVTLHDGIPIPKIIDFGVAKATNQQLTERTLFTAFAQMIGTPLYMSPEQAEMSGLDVDTRSDIYSLGVLLYELLTGTTPVDKKRIKTAAFDEIRRIIREEDPVKPSTCISTLGDQATSVCARRKTDANKLRQNLSGELDWIVMKALEKDRTRRFQTANDFADDVRRHLAGDTVEACPPTFQYRMRKFTRRYRAQVGVATLFLATLIGSSLLAWTLFANARRAKHVAIDATAKARNAEKEAVAARNEVEQQRDIAESNLRLAEEQRAQAESVTSELQRNLYDYNVTKAASAFKEDNNRSVRRFLDACDEHRRGWEWRYLNNSLKGLHSIEIPGSPVEWFRLSSDGKKLVVIDTDNQIRVHAYESGELLWSHDTKDPNSQFLYLSPDGSKVAVVSFWQAAHGKVTVWDVATGQQIWNLDAGAPVGHATFSPDSTHIAIGHALNSSQQRVEYWNLETNTRVWGHDCSSFPMMQFSSDGQKLFISFLSSQSPDAKSKMACWSLEGPVEQWAVQRDASSFLAISPDGSELVTNGPNSTITTWNPKNGSKVAVHPSGHRAGCFYLEFDPTGSYLQTAGPVDAVLHDWKSKQVFRRENVQLEQSIAASFTPNGNHLLTMYRSTTTLDKRATSPRKFQLKLSGHEGGVKSGGICNDAAMFRSVGNDGTLRTWELGNGLEIETRNVDEKVYAYSESPQGSYYATAGTGGVKLWDSKSNKLLYQWPDHGSVYWIDFSANEERITAGGNTDGIYVWNIASHEQIAFHPIDGGGVDNRADGIAFCDRDGSKVAFMSILNGDVLVWDLDSQESKKLEGSIGISGSRSLEVSPDYKTLAVGNGHDVDLWDLESHTLVRKLPGHHSMVTALTFNSDGSRIFSGAKDGEVVVWGTKTGELYLSFEAHSSVAQAGDRRGDRGIECLSISADNNTLVSCGSDGLIKVWETNEPTQEVIAERRKVGEATAVVNGLYKESRTVRDVLSGLTSNEELDPQVMQYAVKIANVRGDRPQAPSDPTALKQNIQFGDVKTKLSEAQQSFLDFVVTSSGINVAEKMGRSEPGNVEDWYRKVRTITGPSASSMAEIETLVAPFLKEYPNAHHFYYVRGCAHAHRDNWEQAYDDLNKSLERLTVGTEIWFRQAFELAPLCIHTGHVARYKQLCNQLMDTGIALSDNPSKVRRATKMLACSTHADVDLTIVVDHAREVTAATVGWNKNWSFLSLALVEFRLQQFQAAAKTISAPANLGGKSMYQLQIPAKLVLAMAHSKLGDADLAVDRFSAAESIFNPPTEPPFDIQFHTDQWHDWLYAQMIYNEARALILEDSDSSPRPVLNR